MKRGENVIFIKTDVIKLDKSKKPAANFTCFSCRIENLNRKACLPKKYIPEEKNTFAKNCEFHVFDGSPSSLQWRGQKPIQHA